MGHALTYVVCQTISLAERLVQCLSGRRTHVVPESKGQMSAGPHNLGTALDGFFLRNSILTHPYLQDDMQQSRIALSILRRQAILIYLAATGVEGMIIRR